MRSVIPPVLCSVLLFAPHSSATPAKQKAKTTAKASGHTTAKGKSGAASSTAKGGAARTKLVRTKSGRMVRVPAHSAPGPSYQTHPDPDRYIEIQKALADRGYYKGEANGQWTDESVDALRRFQAGSNLPDDGKINALTLNGLGLGPRHDGSTASTVPAPAAAAGTTVTGATVGPAASTPSTPAQPPPD